MTEFFVGDAVKVEMPRGYSNRGVLGISLLYSTMPEARFDGAIGTVTEINPTGPYSVHQYLIDFRTHDNSRAGLPWQAQWFREEWLALAERVPVGAGAGARPEPAATVRFGGAPGERQAASSTDGHLNPQVAQAGGFSTGEDSELATQDQPASTPPFSRTTEASADGGGVETTAVEQPTRDHAGEQRGAGEVGPTATGDPAPTSGDADPSAATAELNVRGDTSSDTADLDDGAGRPAEHPGNVGGASTTAPSGPIGETAVTITPAAAGSASDDTAELPSGVAGGGPRARRLSVDDLFPGQSGEGWSRPAGGGCPDGFPLKGNTNSMIYHRPSQSSYGATDPEICFADEATAESHGFRASKAGSARGGDATQPLSRQGTSLLDPNRVAGFEDDGGPTGS